MSRTNQGFSARHAAKTIAVAIAVIITMIGSLTLSPASAAPANDEAQFVALINQLRSQKGIAPVAASGELAGTARSWSSHMAGTGTLAHAGDLSVGVSSQWSLLGENVGVHSGADVNRLFEAFVASPTHYANMVDARFNQIGVGVVTDASGTLWVTQRFMQTATSPTPAPTTAPPTTEAPATTDAPATTAVPTTAAPKATPTTVGEPAAPKATPSTDKATSTTNPVQAENPAPAAADGATGNEKADHLDQELIRQLIIELAA